MRSILVAAGLVASIALSSPAAACLPLCRCAGQLPPAEARARAGAVFIGVVTAIRDTTVTVPGAPPRAVTMRVLASWKGAPSEQVVIRTGRGDGDCGYPFETGKHYLVYAFESENRLDGQRALGTDICHRTSELAFVAPVELQGLGTPLIDRRVPGTRIL